MPCYTVSTATVQFNKNTDRSLLELAAQSIGTRILSFDSATGIVKLRVTSGMEEWTHMELKRAYSEQVVNATAKKNGWRVEWQTNSAGNRVAQVERVSR